MDTPFTTEERWDEALQGESNLIAESEGIDPEVEVGDDTERIIQPFDPSQIRMAQRPSAVYLLLQRITNGEINLMPDFQRHAGIWNQRTQSQLIESLLLRIPLPAFYFDASEDDRWLVIDGLQRLSTLKAFVIDQSLTLKGLEFLTEHTGKRFAELPRALQRRIEETQVTVYLIEQGTPPKVKFNIFKRINTGGLPLSAQEIRHALNLGKSTTLLKSLAESELFLQATDRSIKPTRMADRECVLRYLAFAIQDYGNYNVADELNAFLTNVMVTINQMDDKEIQKWETRFHRAMDAAFQIFGKAAFRKQTQNNKRRSTISKALFEAWAVNLDRLSDEQLALLIQRKDAVQDKFRRLMTEDNEFDKSISYGTGDYKRVQYRFDKIRDLIQGVIHAH